MLRDLDHIQLAMPAGEEAAGRAFYGGVLELEELEKPAELKRRGGLWFRLGARQLHLGVDPDFRPATKAHPAFLVDDLERVRQALVAHGAPVIEDAAVDGVARFFSADPFGNRLEFIQYLVEQSS